MAQDSDHGQQSHGDSSSVPPASKTASPPVAGPGADPVVEASPLAITTNHTHTPPTPTPPLLPPPSASSPAPAAGTTTTAAAATPSVSTEHQQLPPSASIAPVSNSNITSAPSSTTTTPLSPDSSGASTHTVTPAAPAAESAAVQQNGDEGAHAPTYRSDSEMSSQHPGASHGHPVSYPGSAASTYSTVASLPPAQYASYPTMPSSQADAYRPNPMSVGSSAMSLPSMRTIDPIPSQTGSPLGTPHTMPMNVSMAPLVGGVPLYGHPAMGLPSSYGLPSDSIGRYALPHDPRLMGHRGPKKEIKRRTKTGCLTCRKRRIKCDETHPTCNNCKKSKRECLGYDPIFRQQSGLSASTVSNIQPAPASQPPAPSTVPSSVPTSAASAAPNIGARPANSYGNQPSMLPSSYATSQSSTSTSIPSTSTPPPPPSVASSHSLARDDAAYDYQPTSLDPVLHTLPSHAHPAVQDNSRLLDPKKMKIDEIIDLLGPTPPAPQTTYDEGTFNDIVKVYHEMYASGLGAFFETSWYYFSENGQMTFPKDPQLMARMASFLNVLEGVRANDHAQMVSSGILETRLVWELARTPYQTPDAHLVHSFAGLPPDGDAKEAKNRVVVFDALLCGDFLPSNPLTPPLHDPDIHRTRQFEFWYNLAEFVLSRENIFSPETIQIRDDILVRMRHLLDGRENRDVLYSIAVVRELSPHFDPNYGNDLPQHLDETDPRHRLAVASKFILDQSQVTGGTTNVVRRFSDIASRAFVNPGVNVARRT